MYRVRTRQGTLRGMGDIFSSVVTSSGSSADASVNDTSKAAFSIWDSLVNAITGQRSANQIQQQVNDESAAIARASQAPGPSPGSPAGYSSGADLNVAIAQARADQAAITNYQKNNPIDVPQAAGWIIAAMGIFLVIEAVK